MTEKNESAMDFVALSSRADNPGSPCESHTFIRNSNLSRQVIATVETTIRNTGAKSYEDMVLSPGSERQVGCDAQRPPGNRVWDYKIVGARF